MSTFVTASATQSLVPQADLLEGDRYSLRSLAKSDWARIWATLPSRTLPPELASDLQQSIAAVCVQTFTFLTALAGSALVVVTLTVVNLSSTDGQLWTAIHLGEYVLIAFAIRSLRKHQQGGTLSARRVNYTAVLPVVLGAFLWGTLPLVVGTGTAEDFHIAATISAVYCVIGFFWTTGHWPLSMTFAGIVIGSLVTVFWLHDHDAAAIVTLLGPFLVVALFAMSLMAGFSLVHSRYIEARAREREQLIALMMHDYERGGEDFFWDTDVDLHLTQTPSRMVSASRGDPRVTPGASLRTLLREQPHALAALDASEPFEAEIATEGPDGLGAIRLWGRPKYAAGKACGYSGVGSDSGAGRRAAEQANERLDAMVALTSGLAHDFNNQLATVMGAVELAALDPTLGGRTSQYLNRAIDACVRTRRITADLIIASGSDATYHPVPFAAIEALDEIARDLAYNFSDVHIAVAGPGDLWLDADKSHFMRAVQNLMQNACQAIVEADIPGGEVLATISHQSTDRGPVAVTEILDNGPGVDPDLAERIFEPFITSRRARGGTGLGLSVARGFARQAGGSITLVPSRRGAKFALVVPVATDGAPRSLSPT